MSVGVRRWDSLFLSHSGILMVLRRCKLGLEDDDKAPLSTWLEQKKEKEAGNGRKEEMAA